MGFSFFYASESRFRPTLRTVNMQFITADLQFKQKEQIMKRILTIIAAALLCGCGKAELAADTLEPMQQYGNQDISVPVQPYENGFFYMDEYSSLYFAENGLTPVPVSEMKFIDDKPAGMQDRFERYMDEFARTSPLFFFGQHLLYISQYTSAEGVQDFKLIAMEPNGKKRKAIIDFDYAPVSFIVQNDQIIVYEYTTENVQENTGCILHIYDLAGKEKKTIHTEGIIYHLTVSGSDLYFSMSDAVGTESLMCMDLSSFEIRTVRTNASYQTVSGSDAAFRQLSKPYSPDTDLYEIVWKSYIENMKTGERLFETEDELIEYFDDQFIYCSTVKEAERKYRVYRRDGSLYTEFTPAEQLSLPCRPFGPYGTSCSEILGVVNGHLIGLSLNAESGAYMYFTCDIETGECQRIS